MEKYYFEKDGDEMCHTEQWFKGELKDRELTEIEVIVARKTRIKGWFWCCAVDASKENCDCYKKDCSDYSPKNGKNGKCENHSGHYEPTDKKKIIRL